MADETRTFYNGLSQRVLDMRDGTHAEVTAIHGHKSTANSSETALGSAAEFTGEWETNNFEHAAVNVLADEDGTLWVEFGIVEDDGTVVITYQSDRPVYANSAYFRPVVKMPGRALRVRYVNDSSAQGSFNLLTSYGNNLFPASASDDSELLITETERERDVFAVIDGQSVGATVYKVLIDLSDTTNFPHERTGRIDLTGVYFTVDKSGSATGAVRVGVITRIDGTDADISYVQGVTFDNSTEDTIIRDRKFSPSQLKLGVESGALTRVITSFSESDVTAVNTGATLESPRGSSTVTPAVGDIVVKFERSAGSYDAFVSVFYHGEVGT